MYSVRSSLTQTSWFLTTLWLRKLYIEHDMGFDWTTTDGKQEYVPKDLLHLWDSFEEEIKSYDKHHKAKYHNLQHRHDGFSIMASNIKSVWLRCTFWLGTWCTFHLSGPPSPDLLEMWVGGSILPPPASVSHFEVFFSHTCTPFINYSRIK